MNFFTEQEISDINDLKDAAENSVISGKEINFYDMLCSIIMGKQNIHDISADRVKDAIEQIDLEKSFFQSIGNIDCSLHDKISRFFQNALKE